MKRPHLSALLLSSLVSACASVGADADVQIPERASGAFVSAQQGAFVPDASPAAWWRLYDDPVLDALIAQAFAENNELEEAAANLRRVRASLSEARSLRLPSTATTAGGARTRAAATVTPGATDVLPDTDIYDVGLDVSYEIDLFGGVRNRVSAARADAAAAEAALDVVRVTVAAETARAYADSCAANTQIAVAERTLALQQNTLDLTQTLLDAGRGTGLSVASASAQLHATQATLPPLRAARDEALFRLATLTGRPPAEASAEARACTRIPQLEQPIPIGDGAILLARRPDIRQAERQARAAAARVGVAWADLFPRITLGGSLGSSALEMGDLGSARALTFSIGPLISWSFPNLFGGAARVDQARAGRDGAIARFDQTVLVALQEAETALSAYANELDRRTALLAARDQSAEAARLARLRFDAGADSFLTVLDAERTLAAAEAQLAQSEAAVANGQVAVFKALGGGWESEAIGPVATR